MSSLPMTPRQAAELVGVSESTVRRWCDAGALPVERTPGGHRRIDRNKLLRFAQASGLTVLVRSAIATAGRGGRLSPDAELSEQLYGQLASGDLENVRQFVVGLLEHRGEPAALCDQVVAPAMHRIGEQWSVGALPVFREHAATKMMEMALWSALSRLEQPAEAAPSAICAAFTGDPYSLGPVMAGLVLRQIGFDAVVLGPDTPADEVARAARETSAAIVAISIGSLGSVEQRVAELATLARAAEQDDFRLVVGGSQLTRELRRQVSADFFGDTMAHLASYARRLVAAAVP